MGKCEGFAYVLMKKWVGFGPGQFSSVNNVPLLLLRPELSHSALIITHPRTSNVTRSIPRFALHRLLCIPMIAPTRPTITAGHYTLPRAHAHAKQASEGYCTAEQTCFPACLPSCPFCLGKEDKYPCNRKRRLLMHSQHSTAPVTRIYLQVGIYSAPAAVRFVWNG